MNEQIKLLLESGDNLSKVMESGGEWLFAYLIMDSLLGYAVGILAITCAFIGIKYLLSMIPHEQRLRQIRDMLPISGNSYYCNSDHERVLEELNNLLKERERRNK
ncbi:hypothetical protein N9937_00150 [bacterium]|nr:hypothetical protein [bacterium]